MLILSLLTNLSKIEVCPNTLAGLLAPPFFVAGNESKTELLTCILDFLEQPSDY